PDSVMVVVAVFNPAGTVTIISVSLTSLKEAAMPPMATAVTLVRLTPTIVSVVPGTADVGVMDVAETVAVGASALEPPPPPPQATSANKNAMRPRERAMDMDFKEHSKGKRAVNRQVEDSRAG